MNIILPLSPIRLNCCSKPYSPVLKTECGYRCYIAILHLFEIGKSSYAVIFINTGDSIYCSFVTKSPEKRNSYHTIETIAIDIINQSVEGIHQLNISRFYLEDTIVYIFFENYILLRGDMYYL